MLNCNNYHTGPFPLSFPKGQQAPQCAVLTEFRLTNRWNIRNTHTHTTNLQLAHTARLMRCGIVTRLNRTITVCYSSSVWGLSELPHSLNTLRCFRLQGVKPPSRQCRRADAFSLQLHTLHWFQNTGIPSCYVIIIILNQYFLMQKRQMDGRLWKSFKLNLKISFLDVRNTCLQPYYTV